MALRLALRLVLVGLLAIVSAVWHVAPNGAYVTTAHAADSVPFGNNTVNRGADPASSPSDFLHMPWNGEDEESCKALPSSFDVVPLRGTDPKTGASGEWLAQASPFLIPLKTGPPPSES